MKILEGFEESRWATWWGC